MGKKVLLAVALAFLIGMLVVNMVLIRPVVLGNDASSISKAVGQPKTNEERIHLEETAKNSTLYVSGTESVEGEEISWHGSAVVFHIENGLAFALTNSHVSKDASETSFALQYGTTGLFVHTRQGESRPIHHVLSQGFDEKGIDLAILVFETMDGLEPMPIGSRDVERDGWVFAVGNPLETLWNADDGRVLLTGHEGEARTFTHTAMGEAGSSGGGVFDGRGRLVGINTWGVTYTDGSDSMRAINARSASDLFELRVLTVNATETWQRSMIRVDDGQMVSVAAVGEWSISGFEFMCGPDGVRGYDSYSLDLALPHGALLMKDDGPHIHVPELAYAKSDGGRLEFQINDIDLNNNSGSISVAVVVWK